MRTYEPSEISSHSAHSDNHDEKASLGDSKESKNSDGDVKSTEEKLKAERGIGYQMDSDE